MYMDIDCMFLEPYVGFLFGYILDSQPQNILPIVIQ